MNNKKAGCKMQIGYLCIRILDKLYYCHRLAWLYMTGSFPPGQIDHINGKRDDNRWENLRNVSQNTNCQMHHHASKSSKTGYLGVTAEGRSGRYIARFAAKYIGKFDTPQEAHEAYLAYKSVFLASIHSASNVPSLV